jgi:hypothetical protein
MTKSLPYDNMIYLIAIGLTPDGSSTVHIYTQTIHTTTQFANEEECGPRPVFTRYTLTFALQLRRRHGKTSVRVAGDGSLAKSIQNRAYVSIRIHKLIRELAVTHRDSYS